MFNRFRGTIGLKRPTNLGGPVEHERAYQNREEIEGRLERGRHQQDRTGDEFYSPIPVCEAVFTRSFDAVSVGD